MATRRCIYLTALGGCLLFYLAYREWLAWVLLMTVVSLPWFSLLLSLPAILTARPSFHCPDQVTMDTAVRSNLALACPLPLPPVRWRVQAIHNGKRAVYAPGSQLPTAHCGCIRLSLAGFWIYDYLGLLRLPRKSPGCHRLSVLPHSIPISPLPQLQRDASAVLQPKPGGGTAEHHDLRLYRPGDDLRGIHWKLSSKTGKLIFREPLVPRTGKIGIAMTLFGTPDVLDEKLGKLLWLSTYLLEQGLAHQLLCHTGNGQEIIPVADKTGLNAAMLHLLQAPPASTEASADAASLDWCYCIGGVPDEA